jgi:hypothetical protein
VDGGGDGTLLPSFFVHMEGVIQERTASLRASLLGHGLYGRLHSLEDFQVFLEHHVYAVWDFMSLLKSLQRQLTCTEVPWVPRGDPRVRALINEIVLGEDSDTGCGEVPTSHFELYLQAMEEAGANTAPVRCFVDRISRGAALDEASREAGVPVSARRFMEHTFHVIRTRRVHEIAAAFTYGREGVIPGLFGEIVARLDRESAGVLGIFRHYLERHIVLDGDEHFQAGERMVALLCEGDPRKCEEAAVSAAEALEVRLAFWDAIPAGASIVRTRVSLPQRLEVTV